MTDILAVEIDCSGATFKMENVVLHLPSTFFKFEASKTAAKIQSGDLLRTSGQWGRGADRGVFVASDKLKATYMAA